MLSNRYGRFDASGSTFSITDARTPMPWTNIVCNGRYGFVASQTGGGFSWLDNSQLNVLTRWDMDMVRDDRGRFLYVSDLESGDVWSLAPAPCRTDYTEYRCDHRPGSTMFVTEAFGVRAEWTLAVPPDETLEVWHVRLTNTSGRGRRLRIASSLEWCCGVAPDVKREFHRLFITVTHDPARRGLVRVGVLGVLLLASATTANYVMNYMATYANATLHMEASVAFGATAIFGLCSVAIDLVSGWLSDQVGRKPVMLTAWVLLLCAVLPAFSFIARMRTTGALYGATALMSVLLAFGAAPIMTAITESFPPRVRSRAFAITYALAVALFGGTTQFVVTWLIDVTGNPLSPAWYIVGALAVGVAAMVTLEETAPHRSAARASEA